MVRSWDELERIPALKGISSDVERELVPLLQAAAAEDLTQDGLPKRIKLMAVWVGLVCAGLFTLVMLILPDSGFLNAMWAIILVLLLLPSLAIVIYANRNWIGLYLDRFVERAAARKAVMDWVADRFGLAFEDLPNGIPGGLEFLADHRWMPKAVGRLCELMKPRVDMQDALEAFRVSGISPNARAPEDAETNFDPEGFDQLKLEDGLKGQHAGISFTAFEWMEDGGDGPNIPHLVIVLAAPFALQGALQLRSRQHSWPRTPEKGTVWQEVSLPNERLRKKFKIRTTDQTEAHTLFNPAVIERVAGVSHDEKVKAVAKGRHLVFDFAGSNRFEIYNLHTGQWSDESIRQTFTDMVEVLELVETFATAFMLKQGKGDAAASS